MKYFSMFSGIGGFELGIERSRPCDNRRFLPEQEAEGVQRNSSDIKSRPARFECAGYSEIDKHASGIYKWRYPDHINYGDATQIEPADLPEFELLVGGFPCQAFSIAGKGRGFCDSRGTLFFEIARILEEKRPPHILLENVKGLLSNDKGETFQKILEILSDLGYSSLEWQVLNSKNFGIPQNRERVFIIGHTSKRSGREIFPLTRADSEVIRKSKMKLDEITSNVSDAMRIYNIGQINKGISGQVDSPLGIARTLKGLGGGLGAKTGLYAVPTKDGAVYGIDRNYYKGCNNELHRSRRSQVVVPVLTPDREKKRQNGRRFKNDGEPSFTLTQQDKHGIYDGFRIRRLTPMECERLQGFPINWTKYYMDEDKLKKTSDTQRYKVLGNAVTTNVIKTVVERLFL